MIHNLLQIDNNLLSYEGAPALLNPPSIELHLVMPSVIEKA